MIVIKGRRPSNMNYDDYFSDDDSEDGVAPSTVPSSADVSSYQSMNASKAATAKVHHRVHPHLARLTLFHGTKLSSWEASHMIPTHHMHSFSENKVRALARKTDRLQWTIFNQSHMSRTYPAGSRIDSSNYLPILPWSVGCQMVSLNFQTADPSLLMNDGRFRENGGCGYVLKPDDLLQLQQASRKNKPVTPLKLSIRILSGHCLPKPPKTSGGGRDNKCIDPYVRVSVFDIKTSNNVPKEDAVTYQTGVVYNNGFNPIWNEGRMRFLVENVPTAMLQFSIFDKVAPPSADEFVATASIPISCLRQGLRSVPLKDSKNTQGGALDFASFLIEVKKSYGNDLDRRSDSFGTHASHQSGIGSIQPIPMPLEAPLTLQRSRTDYPVSSRSSSLSRPSSTSSSHLPPAASSSMLPRPNHMHQRARTTEHRRGSGGSGTISPVSDRVKLIRSRTDQSRDSSMAEF